MVVKMIMMMTIMLIIETNIKKKRIIKKVEKLVKIVKTIKIKVCNIFINIYINNF